MREFEYNIVGRVTEGTSVVGYMVKSEYTGSQGFLTKKAVEEMALNKQINNVSVQYYNGKVMLKGRGCKLSSLPNYDRSEHLIEKEIPKVEDVNEEIVITGRCLGVKGKSHYIITLISNGKKIKSRVIDREYALKLAKEGSISNARVQLSNGTPVLRGVNCDLAHLPSYRLKDKEVC